MKTATPHADAQPPLRLRRFPQPHRESPSRHAVFDQGRFNAGPRITRPISVAERVRIEPHLEIFNLFSNTPKGNYAGLNHRVFGSLNFPYAPADIGSLNADVRGLTQLPRQFQFGIRGIF